MAEKEKKKPEEEKKRPQEKDYESLVRISGYDLLGSKNIFVGLTRIKGISWTISKIICKKLDIPKTKKVSELSKEEIKKIEDFLKSPKIPKFMKNRASDPETGEESHLYGADLDMKKEFDIKRLRKIRSYKGVRHSLNLPVRGQRTRSNFRSKGKAVGVKRKK